MDTLSLHQGNDGSSFFSAPGGKSVQPQRGSAEAAARPPVKLASKAMKGGGRAGAVPSLLSTKRTRDATASEKSVSGSGRKNKAADCDEEDAAVTETTIGYLFLLECILSWFRSYLRTKRGKTCSHCNKWDKILAHTRDCVARETDPSTKSLGETLLRSWSKKGNRHRQMFENMKRETPK